MPLDLRVSLRPGGHDGSEMMPISFAAIGEHAAVGIIVLGIEHPRSAVLRYAFPPQIGQVSAERRPLPAAVRRAL